MADSSLLLLWDIDGTLISESRSGRIWYDEAVASVLGRSGIAPPEQTAGLTDYSIVEQMLMREGFAGSQATALVPVVLYRLEQLSHEHRSSIAGDRDELPGGRSFIQAWSEPPFVHALLTGNTRHRALTKLGAFRLDALFDFRCSGFGDRTAERWRLIEQARERTGLILCGDESAVPRDSVVVVGDTPADIEAARRTRVSVVVVATGKYSRDELAEREPDLLLDDLDGGGGSLGAFISALR
jgi:phosphoglycolate phosphatase